jgi:hypothetical protein
VRQPSYIHLLMRPVYGFVAAFVFWQLRSVCEANKPLTGVVRLSVDRES